MTEFNSNAYAHIWKTSDLTANPEACDRRYLPLEFPALTILDPPQHFIEVGCGCGSSLLPILKANPGCRVTGTDISPTAVQLFATAAAKAGISVDRIRAFSLDSTDPELCSREYAGG